MLLAGAVRSRDREIFSPHHTCSRIEALSPEFGCSRPPDFAETTHRVWCRLSGALSVYGGQGVYTVPSILIFEHQKQKRTSLSVTSLPKSKRRQ